MWLRYLFYRGLDSTIRAPPTRASTPRRPHVNGLGARTTKSSALKTPRSEVLLTYTRAPQAVSSVVVKVASEHFNVSDQSDLHFTVFSLMWNVFFLIWLVMPEEGWRDCVAMLVLNARWHKCDQSFKCSEGNTNRENVQLTSGFLAQWQFSSTLDNYLYTYYTYLYTFIVVTCSKHDFFCQQLFLFVLDELHC